MNNCSLFFIYFHIIAYISSYQKHQRSTIESPILRLWINSICNYLRQALVILNCVVPIFFSFPRNEC